MWIDAVLLLVAVICTITDLKSRIIDNRVIYPALAFAVVFHTLTGGWNGFAECLFGFAAGLGILIVPYLLGGMGAGDVKLLALIGSLKGAAFVLASSFYMAIIGAGMALGVLLFKGGIRSRLREWGFILFCLRMRIRPNFPAAETPGAKAVSAVYPYGPAIAAGAVVCLALKGWGAA